MESLAMAAVTPGFKVTRGEIRDGQTLGGALSGIVSDRDLYTLVESARPTYDLKDVKPGQPFRVSLTEDGKLRTFAYGIDELRTLRVFNRNGQLHSEVSSRDYEVRTETAAGVIESSLFESIDSIGERGELAMELSEIFGWDIDFNTSIQRGDSFRVVVEKFYLDGDLRRYGRILAAEFSNAGRTLQAVRFDGRDGKVAYYSPSGEPLKKAFLKSPLRFTRVTSRFTSSRLHPVLQYKRAHNGTDLGAPHGTPVRAIGHGTVVSAGYQGGYGNLVVVRHANGFTSYYGHLSKIHTRSGRRVTQGDIIGLVGATGVATGPHLHYGIMKGNRWTDPMRIQGPPAEPLDPADRPAFETAAKAAIEMLPPRAGRTLKASNDVPVW
jgi:murein DD-endopeptidase MepM/ murein hydrolase activator NlpD